MNELQTTISSREVATMMEKRHDHLLRDIEKHTTILEKVTEPNFGLSDLWILSSYKDKTGAKHKVIWDEVYNELQTRFGVNLNTRLKNRKNNAINNGMSKSKVEKINKLDIIDEDKSLVEGLLIVTKDLALKYNIYQENELVIND